MTTPNAALAELRAHLRGLCADRLEPADASFLEALARPTVRLHQSDRSTVSRLGGPAALPKGAKWPTWDAKPLSLLAVVDLEEIAAFTVDVELPQRGLLNFFYEADEQEAWGFEPSHREGWRVLYSETRAAEPAPAPDGAQVFPTIGLSATQSLSIPGWEEPAVSRLVPRHRPKATSKLEELRTRRVREREEQRRQAYFDLLDAWDEVIAVRGPNHQIGGWPRLQQAPIWRECDVVSRGLSLGNPQQANDPRVRALRNTESDWALLLQLDTDDDVGWMWGDVGTLYYALRQSLQRPAAFADAWMVFQCG